MKRTVRIVDTTLRDGEQCPGIVFSPKEKVEIALALDKIGLYEMEVGIYDRRTEGTEYLREIMQKKNNTKVSLWTRLNPADVMEACRQMPDLIHIGAPVSYVQIYSKLRKNKSWVEKTLSECMEVANNFHVPVTLGLEDASRADEGYMIKLVGLAEKLGVQTIRLADTVGIFTPGRSGKMVGHLKNYTSLKIEAHEHNDFGMAVANSIEMVSKGADYIDCTLDGLGERAGNCNMYEFVNACNVKIDTGVSKRSVLEVTELMQRILDSRICG